MLDKGRAALAVAFKGARVSESGIGAYLGQPERTYRLSLIQVHGQRAILQYRTEERTKKRKVFITPRLLIIDEIGYLPIERLGANLFSSS